MLICNIVGARPNFMKIAPVMEALRTHDIPQILVHTGQHYDSAMSDIFFSELGLPKPDIYLGVGSDSHARQTAKVMIGLEEVFVKHQPSLVTVAGDVNSTLAGSLVASKLGIPVAHIESGLRSFDRTMPEEINRIMTDHVSELLFTTEASGNQNLKNEGIPDAKIHFVGNCMVDTLLKHRDRAVAQEPWLKLGLEPEGYGLVTLHRPSNVDNPQVLEKLLSVLTEIAEKVPLLFPIHPRTRERLRQFNVATHPNLRFSEPLSYLSFLGLMAKARVVLTDSGGIQEETTALKVPCLTLRWNTERPITVYSGTNLLVGTDREKILAGFQSVLEGKITQARQPPLWDGKAANRTAQILAETLQN